MPYLQRPCNRAFVVLIRVLIQHRMLRLDCFTVPKQLRVQPFYGKELAGFSVVATSSGLDLWLVQGTLFVCSPLILDDFW